MSCRASRQNQIIMAERGGRYSVCGASGDSILSVDRIMTRLHAPRATCEKRKFARRVAGSTFPRGFGHDYVMRSSCLLGAFAITIFLSVIFRFGKYFRASSRVFSRPREPRRSHYSYLPFHALLTFYAARPSRGRTLLKYHVENNSPSNFAFLSARLILPEYA